MKTFAEFISMNEKSHKVDDYEDISVQFDITIYDDENSKDLKTFKGIGTIIGVHTSGTSTPYSYKGKEDSIDDISTSYDDATFEIDKETEKKIAEWLKDNKFKETDRDYVEFDLKKHKIDLNVMVEKL